MILLSTHLMDFQLLGPRSHMGIQTKSISSTATIHVDITPSLIIVILTKWCGVFWTNILLPVTECTVAKIVWKWQRWRGWRFSRKEYISLGRRNLMAHGRDGISWEYDVSTRRWWLSCKCITAKCSVLTHHTVHTLHMHTCAYMHTQMSIEFF